MIKNPQAAAAFALILATTATAFAAKSSAPESLPEVKVSLVQAIAAAEQHAGGKATRAELERDQKGVMYEVEVVNGAQSTDVKVGPQSGAVIASANDMADHDQDERD